MERPLAVTIETRKPFGPRAGTFSAAGAIAESGAFVNSSFILGESGVPGVVTVHVTLRFFGAAGSFSLRADIDQSATGDPGVLADVGTWQVLGGTGAYERLRGEGRVSGTADDPSDAICRFYVGTMCR